VVVSKMVRKSINESRSNFHNDMVEMTIRATCIQ